mgnify:CR=1 FL=1
MRPFMPEGVWDETSKYGDLRGYKADTGDGLYRRTLYTIWKRTAAPPTMLLFDAPTREICTVKRSRTNTPLQALTLMNDAAFMEFAVALVKLWGLTSMSDQLADVATDRSRPLEVKVSASRALVEMGTPEARRRLLPLVNGTPDDPRDDLKGLALRCNWPDAISPIELLRCLTFPRAASYAGPYFMFIHDLEQQGFDAAESQLEFDQALTGHGLGLNHHNTQQFGELLARKYIDVRHALKLAPR